MDYFEHVELTQWDSTEAFLEVHGNDELFLFTGAASRSYADVDYNRALQSGDVYLCFGRESAGIDHAVLRQFADRCVRIPMVEGRRSLNLANSVAIGLYEAMRQTGFLGLM
jgi:tRNA (cytidine/uridine-2'-O-)-methyltransferase